MPGLIGRKLGMTSLFSEDGKNVPCTVVEVGPCAVTQIRTEQTDGYSAVQVGFGSRKPKNVSKALQGHLKKAGVEGCERIVEFDGFDSDVKVGDSIAASDVFAEGEFLDVTGNSKGKGFQGVVKRYNFAGVGDATHGQHNRLRAPGSIGACSTPSRVFKGMKMAGRTGNKRTTVANLKVMKVLADKNVVVVSGSIPGSKNSIVILQK